MYILCTFIVFLVYLLKQKTMPKLNIKSNELHVKGVNLKVKEELYNIAQNEGISFSDFIKPKLREIAESYPEHMKKKPLDY